MSSQYIIADLESVSILKVNPWGYIETHIIFIAKLNGVRTNLKSDNSAFINLIVKNLINEQGTIDITNFSFEYATGNSMLDASLVKIENEEIFERLNTSALKAVIFTGLVKLENKIKPMKTNTGVQKGIQFDKFELCQDPWP